MENNDPVNRVRGVAALLPLVLAGCGGSGSNSVSPRVAMQSPEATALSWFSSINTHNMPLAVAHFAPADKGQMDWADFDSVSFSNVRCSLVSQSESKQLFQNRSSQASASVMCTFVPHAPSGDPALSDAFWTVYMKRSSSGPWLISSYGTG